MLEQLRLIADDETIPGRREALDAIEHPKAGEAAASLTRPEAYDWTLLLPRTSGMGSARDIRRRVKMLKSVEPRFDYLLYPEERIEFVARGMLNSYAEQYFMGLWSFRINWSIFLFTNYRVILVNTGTKRGRVKSLMWQIPYDRVKKYGAAVHIGSVSFKLDDRKSYRFAGMAKRDRRLLKDYVRTQMQRVREEGFQFPSHRGRDSLCPACATPAAAKAKVCKSCGAEYINPYVPSLMSFFIPGLGDLYLGHRSIAFFELLGFAFVLLVALGIVSGGGSSASAGAAPLPLGFSFVIAIIFVAMANGVDAIITHHVASKGKQIKANAWKG